MNWCKVFLSYDNMCHLDGLRAARKELPWSAPWTNAWMSIQKIIDSLHIWNHKDSTCRENYDPSSLKKELPKGNTMAAEQTFVWLSRLKKVLCAMPKVHHLFYLHRIVKHRNKYTVRCYKKGKSPLLPKARNTSGWVGKPIHRLITAVTTLPSIQGHKSLDNWGEPYSYIHVSHHSFLLKSVVFTVCEHESYAPPYRAIYALYPSYANDIGIHLKYSSLSDEVEL